MMHVEKLGNRLISNIYIYKTQCVCVEYKE